MILPAFDIFSESISCVTSFGIKRIYTLAWKVFFRFCVIGGILLPNAFSCLEMCFDTKMTLPLISFLALKASIALTASSWFLYLTNACSDLSSLILTL